MSHHRFIVGHVLDALRALSDESVHCVVTSPPYFGLRDYGIPPVAWPEVEYSPMPGLPPLKVPAWEGQLGLEPTPEMYVAHLVLVFREIKRVLQDDGTCWVVIGDTYAGSWGNYGAREGKQRSRIAKRWHRPAYEDPRCGWNGLPPTAKPTGGLKEKDLIGIPWRLAFALQADGWYLRSDVVWSKGNPLPESVRDRFTKSHEYIFLFTKSKRYYFDAVTVDEPVVSNHSSGNGFIRPERLSFKNPDGSACGNDKQWVLQPTRNRRTVWEINTEPFPGAHFAVFPRKLAEICILAGTSEKGCCPVCGAPWRRIVERVRTLDGEPVGPGRWPVEGGRRLGPQGVGHWRFATVAETVGWRPTCSCSGNDGSGRCIVLDPFGGAGTTTLVAAALGRDSIYIDLKKEYAEMALERCGFKEGKLFDQHTWKVVLLSKPTSESEDFSRWATSSGKPD